jgi:hypothetical protein
MDKNEKTQRAYRRELVAAISRIDTELGKATKAKQYLDLTTQYWSALEDLSSFDRATWGKYAR